MACNSTLDCQFIQEFWISSSEKQVSHSACRLRCHKVRSRLDCITGIRGDAFLLKMIVANGFELCATWFDGDFRHLNAHVSSTMGVWDGDLAMKATT